jgi:hypothetical protein
MPLCIVIIASTHPLPAQLKSLPLPVNPTPTRWSTDRRTSLVFLLLYILNGEIFRADFENSPLACLAWVLVSPCLKQGSPRMKTIKTALLRIITDLDAISETLKGLGKGMEATIPRVAVE